MDPDIAYFVDILLAFASLFYVVYIVFGRVKHRALIGGYRPGEPGYNVFRKITSTKYLVVSLMFATLFIISAVFDARRVIESSYSKSILVAVPILTILLFCAIVLIISRNLPRDSGRSSKN